MSDAQTQTPPFINLTSLRFAPASATRKKEGQEETPLLKTQNNDSPPIITIKHKVLTSQASKLEERTTHTYNIGI